MASSAKDIQLRELKDTVSQLKTMMSEQTEMIRSLRLIVEEKTAREKSLQEEVHPSNYQYQFNSSLTSIVLNETVWEI